MLTNFWNVISKLSYFRHMLYRFLFCISLSFCLALQSHSQPLEKRLAVVIKKLTSDAQLQHGMASFCVADTTGNILFQLNDEYGLAPASNMKIFTCIAALDLLGKNYRYKTETGFTGNIKDSVLNGDLFIKGNGDPTTGSWRYAQTGADSLMKKLSEILLKKGIKNINGQVILDGSSFSNNPIPGGWSWEDMGNYYGAGSWGLNWHENQYDMRLKPGKKIGDSTEIENIDPPVGYVTFKNELKTAAAGSGDNSLIYLPPNGEVGSIEGTIPQGGDFIVSGSLPEPYTPMIAAIQKGFSDNGIAHSGGFQTSADYALANKPVPHYDSLIDYLYSPTLDSLVYQFMKHSINLYGEDFIKTFALQKSSIGTTEEGVQIVKKIWTERGIDSTAINITDGSGLSAGTRVTTNALVKALVYAKRRDWYPVFYNSLPVVNNMHMKTGTIFGTKAYSGYQTASNGKEYVFSIIVNNYNGATASVIDKMFAVLNELKR